MNILVTGGAGFIGSALVRRLVEAGHRVLNIDLLTYAGSDRNIADLAGNPNHTLVKANIADRRAVAEAFATIQPETVFHLAAESHVDRSIDDASNFIQTNISGTFTLLHAAKDYLGSRQAAKNFRFVQVSTDEVYGSLGDAGQFSETTPYAPNSPYSASKASGDMLARAWHHTYGLPVIVSACSNNYGPRQHPEKFIPNIISSCLLGKPIPVYGDGRNIRDWIFVEDHVDALLALAAKGRPGGTYNVGATNEVMNIDLVGKICSLLDTRQPRADGRSYKDQIAFVKDRPGHDRRYAIDSSKIQRELGWSPRKTFDQGIAETIDWYCRHPEYWRQTAVEAKRLGLSQPDER